MPTVNFLRARAISHSLFHPTTLQKAIDRLKFVQADPIRSPARAQDLILRQRVTDYRAGDLEEQYPALSLEEDFLYAYGFLSRDVWKLLHPRRTDDLSEFEQKVFETVVELGKVHPKQLEEHFGRERVINAWGGYSKATTRVLESLRHQGLLRVAGRAGGIRIYEARQAGSSTIESIVPTERMKELIKVTANIFAPVTERCLQTALAPLRRSLPAPQNTRTLIAELIKSGELEKQIVDGINYLSPPGLYAKNEAPPRSVRFLAPFDPLVWDRRRFEHFWGWEYRFEAYTPAEKRIRGYYTMPVLWIDDIVGWANARIQNGVLNVETGFVNEKPSDSDFHPELEKEIERLKVFLNLEKS